MDVWYLRRSNDGHDNANGRSHPDVGCVVPVVRDSADGGGGGHDDKEQLEPEPQEQRVTRL